jgi:hypothetical protein
MNRQSERPARDDRRPRLTWVALTIIYAVLFLIQLFRWAQGGSVADRILLPAALLKIMRLVGT